MRLLAKILLVCLAIVVAVVALRIVSVHIASSLGYATFNWVDWYKTEDVLIVRIFDEVVALLRTDHGYRIKWFSNAFGPRR